MIWLHLAKRGLEKVECSFNAINYMIWQNFEHGDFSPFLKLALHRCNIIIIIIIIIVIVFIIIIIIIIFYYYYYYYWQQWRQLRWSLRIILQGIL